MKRHNLRDDADLVIRVPDPLVEPFRQDTQRHFAWHIIRWMDGLTMREAHAILKPIERNIQGGREGQPLGWVTRCVEAECIYLEQPS